MSILNKKIEAVYGRTAGIVNTQTKVPPIQFHPEPEEALVDYHIYGNMTQAASKQYSISETPPVNFKSDGNGLSAWDIYGNLTQASSQEYSLTGTSPMNFNSDGNGLSAYSITGNMVQSGVPTPSTPITPEECGDRTANLFDKNNSTLVFEGYNLAIANTFSKGGTGIVLRFPCDALTTYTISGNVDTTLFRVAECNIDTIPDANPVSVSDMIKTTATQTYTLTTRSDTKYILIQVGATAMPDYINVLMLNLGSTALPYVPYGYAIPITTNGTTQTVYLTEPIRKIGDYVDDVSTIGTAGMATRQINCIDLGDLTWIKTGTGNFYASLPKQGINVTNDKVAPALCSHFKIVNANSYGSTPYSCAGSVNNVASVSINKTGYENLTPEEFKEEMRGVKYWYALKTQTTESFTAPTITTISGTNTLTADTTLTPSSISITTTSSVYPDNPIIPEECGDKTENLFDINSTTTDENGNECNGIELPAGKYYITNNSNAAIYWRIGISTTSSTQINQSAPYVYINANDTLVIWVGSGNNGKIMVNSGNAALPYEPYGKYKIPITLAGTTQTIYLNEPIRKIGTYSDSIGEDGIITRNIKKLVLTGEEAWQLWNGNYFSSGIDRKGAVNVIVCSHFVNNKQTGISYDRSSSSGLEINTSAVPFVANVTELKQWLSDQYSAGTPVEVWYVLATPTTETITVPTLTTINGNNTISISTTLNPSSVSLTTVSSVYPKNPITPVECGDYISSGTYAGKYQVQVILNESPYNIYTAEPIRKIGNYSDSINADNTVSRYIKKLVLTGQEEGWQHYTASGGREMSYIRLSNCISSAAVFSTHFSYSTDSFPQKGGIILNEYNNLCFRMLTDEEITSVDEWKAYLAAQYTAGTPVTVWYVLATPESETIASPSLLVSSVQGLNVITTQTNLQVSNLSISYNAPEYSEIVKVYDNLGNLVYRDPKYYDWNVIRKMVRNGNAPDLYPVGTIFYDNFNPETGTAYQVVAYDNHFDPTLTAQGYTHSMTLCELLLTDVITFDAAEAFLYTEVDIPAGTYKFTIPNYDASYGGDKTYYFTSTATLHSGSQIVMSWLYQQTPKTVTGYAGPNPQTNTTALSGFSALTLTEWVDGTSPEATDLGTIAGPTTQLGTSNYGQMNHIHRTRYGSNNYLQSGIRQYINSNSAANAWWTPQTIFDRPYGSRSSAGRLTKLNQDLVSVMATPEIKSRTNSYFETTSLDGTTFTLSTDYIINTDKMFLLSPVEVGFSTTDTTIGTLLDYYVDATNETRIKKRKSNNTAYYWWLRTPYPMHATSVRYVSPSGALGSYAASTSSGAAPACVIQ